MKSFKSTKFLSIVNEIGMVNLGYMNKKTLSYKNRQISSSVSVVLTMKTTYDISCFIFNKNQAKLLQSEILEEAYKEPI